MNKHIKKLFGSTMLLAVTLYSIPVYALTKDETVYTKLNSDGSIKTTFVNNHLINNNKLDLINDESDLLNILNINGNETFKQNGTSVSWQANGNDIFYEGTTNKNLPLEPTIKYYLNDDEKTLKDILGKEGKIRIKMSFKNKEAHEVRVNGRIETLYTPFVVSTGLILKGKNTTNISVNNGKVINNGIDNIVVGLSTPGLSESLKMEELQKLEEITIDFETTKFELPNIYIIATPKVIDEEDLKIFDKMDELYGSINTLKTSIDEIESGANLLLQGSSQITEGTRLIYENLSLISSKLEELDRGTTTLNEGVQNLVNSLSNLTLPSGFNPSQILDLKQANTVAIQVLTNANVDGTLTPVIEGLSKENDFLDLISQKLLPALNSLQTASSSLGELAKGSEAISDGTTALKEGINLLTSKTNELYTGTYTLNEGLQTLTTGINKFNTEGITKIYSYANGDIKTIENRVKSLVRLSEDYQTFSLNNSENEANTKFIMTIDGEKVKENTSYTKKETKDQTLWERIKGLFS